MGNQDESRGIPEQVSNLGALVAEMDATQGVTVTAATFALDFETDTWDVLPPVLPGWVLSGHSKISKGQYCGHRIEYIRRPQ